MKIGRRTFLQSLGAAVLGACAMVYAPACLERVKPREEVQHIRYAMYITDSNGVVVLPEHKVIALIKEGREHEIPLGAPIARLVYEFKAFKL